MKHFIEIYRFHTESRADVIARATKLANSKNMAVIICANADTPPVKILPSDTKTSAAKRMATLEFRSRIGVGVLIAFAVLSGSVTLLYVIIAPILFLWRLFTGGN
jgi:hypothetical protein